MVLASKGTESQGKKVILFKKPLTIIQLSGSKIDFGIIMVVLYGWYGAAGGNEHLCTYAM